MSSAAATSRRPAPHPGSPEEVLAESPGHQVDEGFEDPLAGELEAGPVSYPHRVDGDDLVFRLQVLAEVVRALSQ